MALGIRDLGLRSPSEKLGGLFHFGRMLDKIRSQIKGELPSDYQENLGKGFDEKCVAFLGVKYDGIVECVKEGQTDGEILQWCLAMGHRPSEDEIYMWNEFMRKRGWNDEVSETLEHLKREAGMIARSEIKTMFQFIDADEWRVPNTNHHARSCVDEISSIVNNGASLMPARGQSRRFSPVKARH